MLGPSPLAFLRLQADGVLYNFDPAGWKERGRGELRVNVAPSGAPRPYQGMEPAPARRIARCTLWLLRSSAGHLAVHRAVHACRSAECMIRTGV